MKDVREVEEILGHILIQIILLANLILIVPIGLRIEYDRLVLDNPLTHLKDAEHLLVIIHHVGLVGGVDPQPFAQLRGINFVDDMAIVVVISWHASDHTRADAQCQVAFVGKECQTAAVYPSLLGKLGNCRRIPLCWGQSGATIVPDCLMHPMQHIQYPGHLTSRTGHRIQVVLQPQRLQLGGIGRLVGDAGMSRCCETSKVLPSRNVSM